MDLDPEIRQMVLRSCSSGEIRVAAVKSGMRSLSDDGWRLIGEGVTTPEEVMRVAKDQSMSTAAKNGKAVADVETPANGHAVAK